MMFRLVILTLFASLLINIFGCKTTRNIRSEVCLSNGFNIVKKGTSNDLTVSHVNGKVGSVKENTIKNADVQVYFNKSKEGTFVKLQDTITDELGLFNLPLKEAGFYQLRIKAKGYLPLQSDTLKITLNNFYEVHFCLSNTPID